MRTMFRAACVAAHATGTARGLQRAVLASAVLASVSVPLTAALAPSLAGATSTVKTALLDEESTTTSGGFEKEGAPISLEQASAEAAGYTVTVVTGEQWGKMTSAEFAKYQVLIVGDPHCGTTAPSAVNSAATWTPVVMGKAGLGTAEGNRTLVGTDPEFHYPSHNGAKHLVQDGIAFAGGVEGATGVYFDTSCGEEETSEGTPTGFNITKVLDNLTVTGAGHWTQNLEPPCGGSVQQVAANPVFDEGENKLLDSDIQGWSCSDHITFPAYPTDWHALAVATDTETKPTCGTDPETKEEVCGQAYVLLAGRGVVVKAPNLTLTPEVHQDYAEGTHAVTATVIKSGAAVPGVVVGFAVTGLNVGAVGTCTTSGGAADPACETDATGAVVFTYKDTHGVGEDTINGAITLSGAVQQATATEAWITPPPPPPPPPPPAPEAKKAVLAFGKAHASSAHACVAHAGYVAKVSGTAIASVTFSLDGHSVATVHSPNSHGVFAARLGLRSGGKHRLTMRIAFATASHTAAMTIHRTLARCAAHVVVKPRFTG